MYTYTYADIYLHVYTCIKKIKKFKATDIFHLILNYRVFIHTYIHIER